MHRERRSVDESVKPAVATTRSYSARLVDQLVPNDGRTRGSRRTLGLLTAPPLTTTP